MFCLFGFLFLLGEVVVVLSELCVKREFVREILEVSQKNIMSTCKTYLGNAVPRNKWEKKVLLHVGHLQASVSLLFY